MVVWLLAATVVASTNTVPYTEDFETYFLGESVIGTNGWHAPAGSQGDFALSYSAVP